MLITNHVLAGALIGTASPGPASAFGLGVASHYAMDVVPHWGNGDPKVFLRVAVTDGLIGLTTMACVAWAAPAERRTSVVAGMLGACFPDADKPGELFFGRSPFPWRVDNWHRVIQHESTRRMPQEFLVAAVGMLAVRALVARRAS